jgi:hypothetical protein
MIEGDLGGAAASDSGVPGAGPGARGGGVRAANVRAGPAQPSVPRASADDWWHWRLARRASALAFGRCSAVGVVLCIHCILLDTLNIVWSVPTDSGSSPDTPCCLGRHEAFMGAAPPTPNGLGLAKPTTY